MCGCIYGLTRSCTVLYGLTRSCTIANTIIHRHGTREVLKIIHRFHRFTRMAYVADRISRVFCVSLSDTEHCWAHGSNTVYSVIQGLTGTSIELQPCLGMSWYDLDSNVARVCTNKARIYSIKQGLSRFAKRFSYDCCTVPSTV